MKKKARRKIRRTVRRKTGKKRSKPARRKPARRTTRKATKRTARKPAKKSVLPGLEAVGEVTHYFPKVKAGVLKIKKGSVSVGETLHFKGHTTDFKQKVGSLQLDHVPIETAKKGQEVGIRVKSRVRLNDVAYKIG